MLSPSKDDDHRFPYGPERRKALAVRRKYSSSGLYTNDGSIRPLWTVDWYSYEVIVPSDGVHLVRLGPWTQRLTDEALTFFTNGRQVKSYQVKDLVGDALTLPHSMSHFEWRKSIQVDDRNEALTLVTLGGRKYVFDLRTGAPLRLDGTRQRGTSLASRCCAGGTDVCSL